MDYHRQFNTYLRDEDSNETQDSKDSKAKTHESVSLVESAFTLQTQKKTQGRRLMSLHWGKNTEKTQAAKTQGRLNESSFE